MSLAQEEDLIIPGTTGVISTLGKEANQYGKSKNANKKYQDVDLAQYISEADIVYNIVNGRVKGVPLENLVNPARISNDVTRINNVQEVKRSTASGAGGFYSALVGNNED